MDTWDHLIHAPWMRVERWCVDHAPRALDTLSPGASEAALRAAEAQLGHPLPPDVCASYALHDGCASPYVGGGPAFLFGRAFLSLVRMRESWTYQHGASTRAARTAPALRVPRMRTRAGTRR